MFKRIMSIVLSAATIVGFIPHIPAKSEEIEPYPYTLFAGSNEEDAISINSDNVCINGNIATNGTIKTSTQNFNINGSITENAQEEAKVFFNKIDSKYFSSYVDTYFEDYFLEDSNISINIPIEAEGDISLIGNINITSGLKALNDVRLTGNVKNTQNSAICAKTGDIVIDTDNVNLNGLVYAPNGCVDITAKNLNINSVIIIADKISITCPNLNANYDTQLAGFIGNDPEIDVDLEVAALADYIENDNSLKIYWNTTVPKGNFDIKISDDNVNYQSIGTVTDTSTFTYSIQETFAKKYIKVIETTYYGETYETVPFTVVRDKDSYAVHVLDSDDDKLPDIYELKIGTDPYNADTDNDGLTDYQEYIFTQTDPLVYDSVIKDVADADIDSDKDGLSNIDEITRGTYPWSSDSDEDGITDYNEIKIYFTDPLNADSDKDGIEDGSEVKLGLDPNNAATHGVPDGECVVPQHISADSSVLSSINTTESPYELSIDINTNGDAEKELTVDYSSYSAAIENDAMLGASIDVNIADTCNPEKIVLKYDIKEKFINNTLNMYSALDELNGIKRLNIFRFDVEQGMLLPIDTEFDVDNNQLYAEVDQTGTYCVMDMEIWLHNLDVEFLSESSNAESIPAFKPAPKSSSNVAPEMEQEYVNVPIDLVFILQNAGTSESDFLNEKQIISSICTDIFNKYKNIRVYIITYDSENACIYTENILDNVNLPYVNGELNIPYFTKLSSVKSVLERIKYSRYTNYCNRGAAFKELITKVVLREEADKFIYQLVNGKTKSYNEYDQIDVTNGKWGAYSEIMPDGWHYLDETFGNKVRKIIEDNGDLFITLSDDTDLTVLNHIKGKLSTPLPVYNIIVPTKWKKISLKGALDPENGIDTDDDTLTDWEEVDTSRLIWNEDGSFELPIIDISEIVTHLRRFNADEYKFLLNQSSLNIKRHYLPIISDPASNDSDNDGLLDDEELYSNTMLLCSDSDKDGLSDGKEVELWFDPTNPNPDGDSYNDKEEYENDTSPFEYDLNRKEAAKAFAKGAVLGEFDVPDNIPALMGQISGSFVPFVADARDYLADVFVNGDTKAALWDLGGLILDLIPGGGSAGDAAKAIPKIGRFVGAHSKDASKAINAISKSAEHLPESEKIVSKVLKILPAGALDDLADSVKSGKKLTQKEYDKLLDICKASGKNTDEIVKTTKFKNFRHLKKYLGDPGSGKQWHHIVEQCQAKSTRSGFDISEINKVSNVKATPKEVHKEISRYYSSHQPFIENNKTVRDWLNGQSYEKQYEFGLKQWEKFMKQYGYSID